jgi:hypothetical protein
MRLSTTSWKSNSSLTLACVIVAAALLFAPAVAHAAPFNLVSGNSSVSIDPASTVGMNGWVVDGINQLGSQWWFYRVGETNQAPINGLATPLVNQFSANTLDVSYIGQSIDIILRYTLTGGPAGSGNSTIAQAARIRNKTAAPIQFYLFEYTDLNLNDTPNDDVAALLNPTTIGQWDGAIITTETASIGGMTPVPNRWEIASATDLWSRLLTAPVYSLANAVTPFEGDAAFAFQWDMAIPAGGTKILSKSKILMRGGAIGDTVWFDSNGDGIQDTGEPGIAGVTVNLAADFNHDGIIEYTDSAVTDENGYYLFPNLPGGQYTITIDPSTLPAGAIQTYDLDGLATPNTATITLDTGEVNLDVDFGYWQRASVGDRVWNDLNGNGIQDAGEPGINGVTVTIKGSDGSVIATATTSGDGNYLFADLIPGTYTVSVDASTLPAGFAQTFDLDGVLDNTTTVTLAAGDKRTDVDFGYQQLGSIGDRVWNDLNANGIQDAGEPGINGVTVTIKDGTGNVIGTATTSGDGNYLFGSLPAGNYTVSVDATTLPAGMVQTYDLDGGLDSTAVASLAAGQNRTDVDFGYWQPASVGDRVWNDLNANHLQDAGEPGINGVKVTLKNSSGTVIGTAVTSGDGNYLFTKLPAGTYTVSVDASTLPAGMVETYDLDGGLDNTAVASLAAGQNRTDVDFGYWQPASVGDRVWNDLNGNGIQDAGEPGINGVTITLKNGSGTVIATAITSGDGGHLFSGLPAGAYTVSVDATTLPLGMHQTFDLDGILDSSTIITLATGQNRTDVDFGYTGISQSEGGGNHTTYTQGGWGSKPKGGNPGALLLANFSLVYPGGSVSIGGGYKLTFTSAKAIENFLPQGGKPGVLKVSATNPTSSAAAVFAGQVLALRLSVDFSNRGITGHGLGSVKLTSGPLSGRTIAQVLDLAMRVLGGETSALPSGMTVSQLNDVVDGINNRYDG